MRVFRLFSLIVGLGVTAFVLGVRSPSDLKTISTAERSAFNEATRASDAALDCAGLEKELVATMSAPAMQRYAAKAGAAMQKVSAAVEKGGRMTGQNAIAIAASLAPMRAGQSGALVEILPQLARSERLIQFGLTKQCSWITAAKKTEYDPRQSPPR